MTSHPNFDRAQAILDATRRGDYAPAFDNFADDIVMENGPGAGPWHRARGKDDLALMLLELAGFFGDTFHLKFRSYATAASQAASTARICSSAG